MRNCSTDKGEARMTIIKWLSATIDELRKWRGSARVNPVRRIVFPVALITCAMIGSSLSVTAWSADSSSLAPGKPRKVVAAGVGYEDAETSIITVKTYDAENGEILSNETYELNVREDAASADSQPRERIFAGGVGVGADGLSEFTLRVYDAVTGRFLWEGVLNLNVPNQESGSTRRVVAHLDVPQATVTKVRARSAPHGQPQFFLSTIDLLTGQLVWADHFSPGASTLARPERISRVIADQTEGAMLSQLIEFRIRMMDDGGQKILWEDTIEPTVEEIDLADSHDAAAENLPGWHSEGLGEFIYEKI
ncbi:MAG TPA: hypothetical protein VN638_12740 [Nitrospiraceae bacterium]|nr:hypothetical protein [Nitrospiraceae bacterium]